MSYIADNIFEASGEAAALCREIDWSNTSLGPVESWPDALRTIVRTTLASPFPINLWCGPDRILIYNDGYSHVLGDKHPSAMGKPGSEVWSEIWDQVGPMFTQIESGGPPLYADDAPFIIERDGHEQQAFYTFSLSPVRDDRGEIVAYLNVVSETTSRVFAELSREAALENVARAEARLREVFAQAPAFLAVLRGADHVFEYVNDAYYQLVGHRDLIGRPVWDALPEVRGQGFEELLDQVINTGEPFIGREVPVTVQRTPQSRPEQRFVDLVYYPIREPDGSRSGVVAHGSDVTEYVLASRAKSQFLANMSHEIRTPINAVLGYTDLLDAGVAGDLNGQQEEYISRVKSAGRHLLTLVNDILDLSKIEAGEMLVRNEVLDGKGLVREALQIIAAEAHGRGLTLNDRCECEDDLKVIGDSNRIRQVLLNLLSNAMKFTESRGSVTVNCTRREQPPAQAALPELGPWMVIGVTDTGIGIDAEHQVSIFEPFVQAESGLTRTVGGTGLGLSISRRLARLMGGDLLVKSAVGVGSNFELWLPAAGQHVI